MVRFISGYNFLKLWLIIFYLAYNVWGKNSLYKHDIFCDSKSIFKEP